MNVATTVELQTWVQGFGVDAEVREPPEFRDRVAMIRSLGDQLAFANAQLMQLDMAQRDHTALLRAGAGVEAYGAHLREDDDRPDYLKGVD